MTGRWHWLLGMAMWGATAPCLGAILTPGVALQRPGSGPDLGPTYAVGQPLHIANENLVARLSSRFVESRLAKGLAGTLNSWVYENPASGMLTFVYQYISDKSLYSPRYTRYLDSSTLGNGFTPGSANWAGVSIEQAGTYGTGSSTADGMRTGWTNGDPHQIVRNGSGNEAIEIAWRGTAPMEGTRLFGNTGDYSSWIWLETDATDWGQGIAGLADSGAISVARYLGPTILVPEPASLAIWLALGLAAMAFTLRRRARMEQG